VEAISKIGGNLLLDKEISTNFTRITSKWKTKINKLQRHSIVVNRNSLVKEQVRMETTMEGRLST
jgi:hypothetical protein